MKKIKKPKQKHVPIRTCVACREAKPKRELTRIVLLPDGDVVIDKTGKLNGRGAYVCRRRSCGEEALMRGALARALRVSLSSGDVDELQSYFASLPAPPAKIEAGP